ncbi:hypothetical protein [Acinetobacter sp.]|uniref:hypothetical protein n=1 Tax=Acinetobacter sp. TaxID=472 RepID=UPI003D016D59
MKKNMKIFLIISTIAFIVLSVIAIWQYTSYQKLTKRENLTLDEYIIVTATQVLGKTTTGKERVKGLDEIDGIKRLFLNGDEILVKDITRIGYSSDTIDVMKVLSRDEEFINTVNGISFQYVLESQDKYGNSIEVIDCIITFKNDAIREINWENISITNMQDLAYTYWINEEN